MLPPARASENADNSGVLCPDGLDNPELEHEHTVLLGSQSEQVHSPLSEQEEEEEHAREVLSWKRLPWWRRPSPYWLVIGTFFSSVGFSALLAPKVALLTALACRVHRPEYVMSDHALYSFTYPSTHGLVSITGNAVDAPIFHLLDSGDILSHSAYTSLSSYAPDEPSPQQKCASDPVVQAVVARLSAVFATSMGVLGCLTGGWWGSLSDRYGRRTVLFISLLGLFLTELSYAITAWFMDILPGGYWFPLVGCLTEGMFGGMASGVATTHAYIADTTDSSTRSRYFSMMLGMMYMGVAVGPALGGLLMRSTGTILSVFYLATILHAIYAMFILLILPEALTRARARAACQRQKQEKANKTSSARARNVFVGFLKPLAVLLPQQSSDDNPPKHRSRNWSLFLLAIAYALVTGSMGALSYKIQYAAAQFKWTPEITSYYVSLLGATRAIFLAVVLPLFIKYIKRAPIQLPSTPEEPLRGTIGPSPSRSLPGTVPASPSEPRSPVSRSLVFDFILARTSAGLDFAAFLGMTVASTGTLFALASAIGSFAAGFPPAVFALALDIYSRRRSQDQKETGKLFGAFSVLQALGGQIISPLVYGFIYSKTVADFPQAIMFVSTSISFLAFICLSFVRVPSESVGDRAMPGDTYEQDTGLLPTENDVEGR